MAPGRMRLACRSSEWLSWRSSPSSSLCCTLWGSRWYQDDKSQSHPNSFAHQFARFSCHLSEGTNSWGMNLHSKTPSYWFWWTLVSSHPLWGVWGFTQSGLLLKGHYSCLQPISTLRLFKEASPFSVSKSYVCLMSYSSVETTSVPTGLLLRSVHRSQARSRPDRYLDPCIPLTSDQ